ncbi:Apoptotic ATPase [Handroanthus impetiginosus]|uniref:Apoptotic ATPase n=1 Tax=Handroanthus impetiginosus TaxID=429701 RepID=A0A2G9G849_9LAMI|nr:Apoptotic ATPase [Handroanthus impetiginosus]
MTIKRLLESHKTSFLPPCQRIIQFAYEEVSSLQQGLERLEQQLLTNSNNEEVTALTGQIRDAACKLEDSLESHVLDQFLAQSKSFGLGRPLILSPNLEEIKHGITCFQEMMEKLEKTMRELRNPLPEEDVVVSPTIHFDGERSGMVGFSDLFDNIEDQLMSPYVVDKLFLFSIFGMAGIGKSALVKEIYKDQLDFKHFDCCAWITIGPEHQLKKVLLHDKLHKEGDEILVKNLYASLKENNNGSRVLLTTRLEEVARYPDMSSRYHRMRFLDEEESWNLLQQKVFGEECFCPFRLEKAGRKIAQKCEGLPLTIVTVADILSKSEKTLEYWNKILLPSYKYLPQHLKAAFLYTGVFPPSSKVRASKLIRLWIVERFLEPKYSQGLEEYVKKCLSDLVSSSVVRSERWLLHEIKSWSLCSPFWYLCTREARKEKFFHVLETYPNSFNESVDSQRRFCILNNILLGIKDVHNSMKSITTIHSLLCTGPEHHYPVPLLTGLKLLRVLDAQAIRFYNFPDEVLKLIHLRYLSITYSGNLPASISKLWNLQYLIVRQHMSISKSSRDQSYLPIVIWDMQELEHLQIVGSNLPNPCGGALLPNLLSLSDISVSSCKKEILERFPMLNKLGVRIELTPEAAEPLYLFYHLSVLRGLKSFKCVIVNPNLSRSQIVAPPTHFTTFPVFLRKMSLSGFGYPWESIRVIAQLPKLEVLKLRYYAFRGPEWVIHGGEFKKLRFLLLEDTDLVHWKVRDGDRIPFIRHIIIKHCYKLKDVPLYTVVLELVDCPSVDSSVRENDASVVHSSWYDRKVKS